MKKTDRSYKSDKRKKEIENQKRQEMKRQRRFHNTIQEGETENSPVGPGENTGDQKPQDQSGE